MKRILLFDPYPVVGRGFTELIKMASPELETLVILNLDELAETDLTRRPDLLIMTVNTPAEIPPLAMLRRIQAVFPDILIVFFDEGHLESNVLRWLKYGISGYLMKMESASLLLQCIDVVLRGERFLSPMGWKRQLTPNPKEETVTKRHKLAAKEYEIAQYLSLGKSTTWIATKLERSPSTISTTKKNIYDKLKIDNVIDLCRLMPKVSIDHNLTEKITRYK